MFLHEKHIVSICQGRLVATMLNVLSITELSITSMIATSFRCSHGLMVLFDASATSRFPANRLDNDHVVPLRVYALFVLFKVHLVVWSRRLRPLGRRLVDTASMLGRSFCIHSLV